MGIFTSRGVSPAHKKHTESQKPTRLNGVESVTIPMKQHIGAPCEPTVKVGDSVKVGQVIGDTGAFMSAPIHASVSGTVARIAEIRLASGEKVKAVNSDLISYYVSGSDDAWLKENAETTWGDAVITKPISVDAFHSWLKAQDGVFAAAII